MAEHDAHAHEVPGAEFTEHERTYEGFVAVTTIGILHVITVVLALVMFGFGGSGGFWLGLLTLFLAAASAAIGIARGGAWKPAGWVLALSAVLALLAVS